MDCGVRDTAFKSDAVGVALQSAFGADNEAVDFTKIKLLDGQLKVPSITLTGGKSPGGSKFYRKKIIASAWLV